MPNPIHRLLADATLRHVIVLALLVLLAAALVLAPAAYVLHLDSQVHRLRVT